MSNAVLENNFLEQMIAAEQASQEILHLTANENILSNTARFALSSRLGQRYHMDPDLILSKQGMAKKGDLLYRSITEALEIEKIAKTLLNDMVGSSFADFRPLSGVHTTITSIAACTSPGDLILSIPPCVGGHFATRLLVLSMGREHQFLPVLSDFSGLDLTALNQFKSPVLIFLDDGICCYVRLSEQLADSKHRHTPRIHDGSHSLGLICAKTMPSSLEIGCSILQANTHKTFPGPQKAIYLTKDERLANSLKATLSNGYVSSQHTHNALALYIAIQEMSLFSEAYGIQMIKNAAALRDALQRRGFTVYTPPCQFPDNHMLFIEHPHAAAFTQSLLEAGISTNCRTLFNRQLIRLGVQEITRMGMKEADMDTIAGFFGDAESFSEIVRSKVVELLQTFSKVYYSLDP